MREIKACPTPPWEKSLVDHQTLFLGLLCPTGDQRRKRSSNGSLRMRCFQYPWQYLSDGLCFTTLSILSVSPEVAQSASQGFPVTRGMETHKERRASVCREEERFSFKICWIVSTPGKRVSCTTIHPIFWPHDKNAKWLSDTSLLYPFYYKYIK